MKKKSEFFIWKVSVFGGEKTSCTFAVFVPMMDLGEIHVYGGLTFASSHKGNLYLTTPYRVKLLPVLLQEGVYRGLLTLVAY